MDDIIESFRADRQSIQDVKETLFGFGCYVGEVLVRAAGGAWRENDEEHRKFMNAPFLVQLPSGTICNPIGKAFKRFNSGEEDDLPYFFTVFARHGNAR